MGYDPTDCMFVCYKNYTAYIRLHLNSTETTNGVERIKMSLFIDMTDVKSDKIPMNDIVPIAKAVGCSILCNSISDHGWITEELVKTIYNKCKGTQPKSIIDYMYNKFKNMLPTSMLTFTTDDGSYALLKNIAGSDFFTDVHRVLIVNDIVIDPILGYGPIDIASYVSRMLKIDNMSLNYEESIIGDNKKSIIKALTGF